MGLPPTFNRILSGFDSHTAYFIFQDSTQGESVRLLTEIEVGSIPTPGASFAACLRRLERAAYIREAVSPPFRRLRSYGSLHSKVSVKVI